MRIFTLALTNNYPQENFEESKSMHIFLENFLFKIVENHHYLHNKKLNYRQLNPKTKSSLLC